LSVDRLQVSVSLITLLLVPSPGHFSDILLHPLFCCRVNFFSQFCPFSSARVFPCSSLPSAFFLVVDFHSPVQRLFLPHPTAAECAFSLLLTTGLLFRFLFLGLMAFSLARPRHFSPLVPAASVFLFLFFAAIFSSGVNLQCFAWTSRSCTLSRLCDHSRLSTTCSFFCPPNANFFSSLPKVLPSSTTTSRAHLPSPIAASFFSFFSFWFRSIARLSFGVPQQP